MPRFGSLKYIKGNLGERIFKKFAIYLRAILLTGVIVAILFPFRGWLNPTTVALIFLIPVLICTTWWGLIPGIISSILTFLLYNFLFLTPYYTFTVHDSQDVVALGIFLVTAVLISQLVGWSKKNLEIAISREKELSRLYELSLSLTGVNNPKEVAEIIVTNGTEAIPNCAVEVTIFLDQQTLLVKNSNIAFESDLEIISNKVFALETARGKVGELHLQKRYFPLSQPEIRLMQAFTAQGALALERAVLAQVENNTKVLIESDRMKTALLSSVSHELRTPLAAIKAFVTSLLSDQVSWDSIERSDLLSSIDEETDHLNLLVGNLLDISRIESGDMNPNKKWNLLSEIVEAAIKRTHYTLNNFTIKVDIPDDQPLIPVDYMQLEQVFTNLFSNSAKYSPKGSIIRVWAEKNDKNELLVELHNQSPHVEQEHIDRIFTKFYRVTDSDKVSGTGLGLSICKGIIEAHGGRIWAENLSEGFVFKFTIPLHAKDMAPPIITPEIV
ncbi:MAG: hypothetical protein CVU39_08620 [Chloroflexi bacterium HGW-Chloroflexi-10]|nr:MAG: hypothetical protein CVU39_08620 [Chloroflexi bacterium HGW-Chloroflexi-10]